MAELRRILRNNDPQEIATLFEDFFVDVVDETHILRLAVALGSTAAVRILCSEPYLVKITNDCMTHARDVSRDGAMIACLQECGWKPPVGSNLLSLRFLHHRCESGEAAATQTMRAAQASNSGT